MSIHRFVLHNGKIFDNADNILAPGQLGLLAGWGVFSTLRLNDGRIFAWERHWARMVRDAKLMNVPMPASAGQVEADLLRLAEANNAPDCTLRIVVVRNGGGMWEGPQAARPSDVMALTAEFKNWGGSVRLGIQPSARFAASDFTRAKILSWSENLTWLERAQGNGFDEVALLNEHNRVAECTSANIFASFDGRIHTPPLTDGCLPGITREVLLELGQGRVVETPLTLDNLYEADEVFITSTTRDLLPVREIDGHTLRSKGVLRAALAQEFAVFLQEDIARRQPAMARS